MLSNHSRFFRRFRFYVLTIIALGISSLAFSFAAQAQIDNAGGGGGTSCFYVDDTLICPSAPPPSVTSPTATPSSSPHSSPTPSASSGQNNPGSSDSNTGTSGGTAVNSTTKSTPSPSPVSSTSSTAIKASPSPSAKTTKSPSPLATSTPSTTATESPIANTTSASPEAALLATVTPSPSPSTTSNITPSTSKASLQLPVFFKGLTDKAVDLPTETITAVTLVPSLITATGSTVAAITLNTFQALFNLPSLLTQLWLHLLFLLGIRRRQLPWGRVINSVDGTPMANTLVQLFASNEAGQPSKMIEQTLTDKEGRYGFLITPGTYQIKVNRTGFSFPTKVIHNTYLGQAFHIENQQTLAMDLFIDPISAVAAPTIFNKLRLGLERLRLVFLVLGTGLLGYSLSKQVDIINLVLAALYLGLWLNEILHLNTSRHTLKLTDSTQRILPFTLFRLQPSNGKGQPINKVTNASGESFILVPAGEYQLTVPSPRHPDGQTQTINLPHGIAPKNMSIVVDY